MSIGSIWHYWIIWLQWYLWRKDLRKVFWNHLLYWILLRCMHWIISYNFNSRLTYFWVFRDNWLLVLGRTWGGISLIWWNHDFVSIFIMGLPNGLNFLFGLLMLLLLLLLHWYRSLFFLKRCRNNQGMRHISGVLLLCFSLL